MKSKNNNCIIKKDDVVQINIEDLGMDGEGIGHYEGYTLFVKDAVPGDIVKVKVMKAKKNYGYARLTEVVEASVNRVMPRCSIARQCGGCQIQHISYDKQLEFKQNHIRNCLERIAGMNNVDEIMEPIVGMEEPYFYRNKAQFPVGYAKDGSIVAGFYAGRSHNIIQTDKCCIQAEINEQIIDVVLNFMKDYKIAPYDEKTGKGIVRHIMTRVGYVTKEIMVCIVINADGLSKKASEELVNRLVAIDNMTSISLNVNKENTNVIMGEKLISLYGNLYITDYIGDIKYQISPLSFYQVNPVQTKKLYELAMEYSGLNNSDSGKENVVWDMYCGIGTISLFLAQKAKKVYGVEIVPQAIEDARRNAKINGLDNVEFFCGAAEDVVPEKYAENKDGMKADIVVVDPPRKGCDVKLLETLVKMEPERIVYVSCDPSTLARDLKWLGENGYEVKKVRGVDQFGHTVHVETVVLLSQQKPDDVIEVEIELDELDLTSAESKATYKEIQEYVLKEYGLKVSNLYISQVKRKCGIEVGENYNLPKSEGARGPVDLCSARTGAGAETARQPQCPEEKEKAIRDALEHFGMV